MEIPTTDQIVEWRTHEVTVAYLHFLAMWRESLKDQWAHRVFQTHEDNLYALAQVDLLERLIELKDKEEFLGVLSSVNEDSEQVGPEGPGPGDPGEAL